MRKARRWRREERAKARVGFMVDSVNGVVGDTLLVLWRSLYRRMFKVYTCYYIHSFNTVI